MNTVTILCIIIALLSIALFIAIVCLILQHKALKSANRQLSWISMLHPGD